MKYCTYVLFLRDVIPLPHNAIQSTNRSTIVHNTPTHLVVGKARGAIVQNLSQNCWYGGTSLAPEVRRHKKRACEGLEGVFLHRPHRPGKCHHWITNRLRTRLQSNKAMLTFTFPLSHRAFLRKRRSRTDHPGVSAIQFVIGCSRPKVYPGQPSNKQIHGKRTFHNMQ